MITYGVIVSSYYEKNRAGFVTAFGIASGVIGMALNMFVSARVTLNYGLLHSSFYCFIFSTLSFTCTFITLKIDSKVTLDIINGIN